MVVQVEVVWISLMTYLALHVIVRFVVAVVIVRLFVVVGAVLVVVSVKG